LGEKALTLWAQSAQQAVCEAYDRHGRGDEFTENLNEEFFWG
jgi:hypothetical protein